MNKQQIYDRVAQITRDAMRQAFDERGSADAEGFRVLWPMPTEVAAVYEKLRSRHQTELNALAIACGLQGGHVDMWSTGRCFICGADLAQAPQAQAANLLKG